MKAERDRLADGGADHLRVGMALPDIDLGSTSGGNISLAEMAGRTVVYAYTWTGRPDMSDPPHWDDIPGAHGSTPQTEAYREAYPEFAAMGVAVYGLSTQATSFQQEMVARLGVPFDVLSDSELAFAKALRLPTFMTGGVTYLKRLTLVIEDGKIAHVIYPVYPPQENAAQVLAWLGQA